MRIFFIIFFVFVGHVSFSQNTKLPLKDGFTQFFYENGNVSSEGYIKNGKPDGYWKTFYPNGVLKSEGNRKFFMLDSIWIFYNEKGDTSLIISYKQDKKNGYLITYQWSYDSLGNKTGGIISKELYIDDVKQGNSYYFKNGKLHKIIPYKDGKKSGISKEFDENGNIIAIVEYSNDFIIQREYINQVDAKGLKQGYWKTFYPNGKIEKEIFYENDTITGYYKEFDKNGQLIVKKLYRKGVEISDSIVDSLQILDWKEEFYENGRRKYYGAFKNGLKVGMHKEYDPEGKAIVAKIYDDNGNLIAEGIVDSLDRKQGDWKMFYETGNIKAKGKYINDIQTGTWIYYYPDGKIEQIGNYKKGKIDGKWIWYYPNQQILREEYYDLGKEEGAFVEYNDTGKVILKGQYSDGERTGLWIYQVGDITEIGKYTEGVKDSIWKSIYSNGKLAEVETYVQGYLNGSYKSYYPNGKLKCEGYYIMGRKEKKWYFMDENGVLYLTITYKNDKEYKFNGVKVKLPKGSFE
ncbi:MAG: toxin-antitoxin system YwqK family antitoxin [Bacteroidales bacterium]